MTLARRMRENHQRIRRSGTTRKPGPESLEPRQHLLGEVRSRPGMGRAKFLLPGACKIYLLRGGGNLYAFENDLWPILAEVEGFRLLIGQDGELPQSCLKAKVNLAYKYAIGSGDSVQHLISYSYLGLVEELTLQGVASEFSHLLSLYKIQDW